jgi:hypothetical protein
VGTIVKKDSIKSGTKSPFEALTPFKVSKKKTVVSFKKGDNKMA